MTSAINWEVTDFKIQGNDFVLFSNGRMQVPANVLIRAVNPVDSSVYTLTAAELARIQLIDYYVPGRELADGWKYTATENDFAHTMPGVKSAGHEENDVKNEQSKRYWVSTTKVETKLIGTRIQQPNGIWITTHSDHYDSHVTLRGSAAVHYNMNNVEFTREDTDQGNDWDQDNYYLTSKVHPFKKSELSGYHSPNHPNLGMRNAMKFWGGPGTGKRSTFTHYIWEMGPTTRVDRGLTHYDDGSGTHKPHKVNMVINERPYAMCFTRLSIKGYPGYSQNWWYNSWLRILDIYGNSGDFNLPRVSHNHLELTSRNTVSVAGSPDDVVFCDDHIPEGDLMPHGHC
ncbi:hypothetical protein BBO_04438 [Beauveria brongniartii RCEF 3172]|uniref:Uncharacterized protein n=1 Tax=Beauveria brongniartii RCEF 3172 TaxID=1081107 RepID=A0A167EKS5_9HYPO|nr:hypothetical protein BBO_04438 [Beauveria brongniartii RCEF 3172]